MAAAPIFYVVPGSAVKRAIDSKSTERFSRPWRRHTVFTLRGDSINPDSYFLRYPGQARRSHHRATGAISEARFRRAASNGSRAFRRTATGNLARASAVQI